MSERNGTFLEAISYGKPVITTKEKNTSSNFIDNQNCILIESKNVESISKNIERLMNDRGLYYRISKEASSLSKPYNLRNVTTEYAKFYSNL